MAFNMAMSCVKDGYSANSFGLFFFINFFCIFLSLLLTAPSYVDLCPGPFEDTQFDAVIDVETSDDCMDDEGIY